LLRVRSSVALFAGIGLAAILVGRAPAEEDSERQSPTLNIEVTESLISVSGHVSSFAHEAILRQTVQKRFTGKEFEIQLAVVPAMPPGWALVTELALKAMAETTSGKAAINPAGVEIRVITSDGSRWADAASRLERNLLPNMLFVPLVAEVRRAGPLHRQCLELFRTALRGRRIEFARSSVDLRPSVQPVLDELVQIVTDCPGTEIAITGHTDASGDQGSNLALSQTRADAIATYFVDAGIKANRVTANGAGSSRPLVEGDTPHARQLNRRIDIDLLFPGEDDSTLDERQ
jgi:outer membrane protein OmpA-like peptidoglycan-associated protein